MQHKNGMRTYLIVTILLLAGALAQAQSVVEPVGTWVDHYGELPGTTITDHLGRTLHTHDFAHGMTVMTFIVDECQACENFLNQLQAALDMSHHDAVSIVVSPNTSDSLLHRVSSMVPDAIILSDDDSRLATMFGVKQAPSAYVFFNGQYYGKLHWGAKAEQIATVIEDIATGSLERKPPQSALVTPGILPELVGLDGHGNLVRIRQFDEPTVIIFASQDCGHCVAELEDIRAYDGTLPFDIIVVYRDTPDHLTSSDVESSVEVLHDIDGRTFMTYGVWGTPTHVIASGNRIHRVWVGRTSIDDLQRRVQEATSE